MEISNFIEAKAGSKGGSCTRVLLICRVVVIRFAQRTAARGIATTTTNREMALPKCLVFDLDGCVWYPEMYHLWGSGGSPFKKREDGDLTDAGGTKVYLMGYVRQLMYELKTDKKWEGTAVAVASCCDEPAWARECLQKFEVGDGVTLKDIVSVEGEPSTGVYHFLPPAFMQCAIVCAAIEIHKGSKSGHLRNISQATGVALEDMVFFDNERGNCSTVAKLGVTVCYCPSGVTQEDWENTLSKFPAPGEILQV